MPESTLSMQTMLHVSCKYLDSFLLAHSISASGVMFDIPLSATQCEVLKGQSNTILAFKQSSMEWTGLTAPENPSLNAIREGTVEIELQSDLTRFILGECFRRLNPLLPCCRQSNRNTQVCWMQARHQR